MRIISGTARGLTLNTLEGDSTRPTRDMVREALFSMLLNKIPDCVFLDLFAGSGAIGIEALSRGASFCNFVDINPQAVYIIKENIKKAKFENNSQVYNTDYKKAISKFDSNMFDIIYVDPPYNKEIGIDAIDVHHKKPLSIDGKEQKVEPTSEYLACLCSNCHRMIHRRRNSVFSVEELRQIILENKR